MGWLGFQGQSTWGKTKCYLSRLCIVIIFFNQCAVYSHLWASVPKCSKENSELEVFLYKYQKIYLKLA